MKVLQTSHQEGLHPYHFQHMQALQPKNERAQAISDNIL